MIDNLTINKIKDAANIVDVIRDFYELKPDGAGTFGCLCPFHDDRHIGSFKVSERRNYYTCFACGAHGGPVDFLMNHERLSFVEAIKWLGAKYGIEVEGADEYKEKVSHCTPHAPLPPLKMLVLNGDYLKVQMLLREETNFVKWLRSLTWNQEQQTRVDKVLTNYGVGGTRDGDTIFWQIDEQGRLRSGKIMAYKPDGHRDKEAHPFVDRRTGETKYRPVGWMHARLEKLGKLNMEDCRYVNTLFGMHLLYLRPSATVNIVESEKTALICAIAYGDNHNHIWMATGGLKFLNEETLKPLIDAGRDIMLYPDKDGVAAWREQMIKIPYKQLHINTDFIDNYWKPEDGPKADIADVILRLIQPQPSDLDMMRQAHPGILDDLIDKLGLEPIQ